MPKTPSLGSVWVSPLSRETSAAQASFKWFYREGVNIAFDHLGMCRISCGAGKGGGTMEQLQGSISGADLDKMRAYPVRRVWEHCSPVHLLTGPSLLSCFSFSFSLSSVFPQLVLPASRFQECQQNYQRGSLQPECWGCIFLAASLCNNFKTLNFSWHVNPLCGPLMAIANRLHYPAVILSKCLVTFFKYKIKWLDR